MARTFVLHIKVRIVQMYTIVARQANLYEGIIQAQLIKKGCLFAELCEALSGHVLGHTACVTA